MQSSRVSSEKIRCLDKERKPWKAIENIADHKNQWFVTDSQ